MPPFRGVQLAVGNLPLVRVSQSGIQFIFDEEQGFLPESFVVCKFGNPGDVGHALDLHPGAAGNGYIHIFARRADAGSD